MKKAVIIISPENFQDQEYFEPKKALEAEGFLVKTASTRVGDIIGSEGGVAVSDLAVQMVAPEEYEALVLSGGGAEIYFDNKHVLSLLKELNGEGKVIGSISSSVNTLANAGILEGRNATCADDEAIVQNLREQGANYTGLAVTIDGNIITSSSYKSAREFASELVNLLREKNNK